MAEWFDPEILNAEQSEVYRISSDALRPAGDFGSYAIANRGGGIGASLVENHNLMYGPQRVAQYATLLGKRTFDRIADIGCGLGITTDALARHYPNAKVIGIEISQDAIEFAQNHFNGPEFIKMAISPPTPLPGRFDLILCQEFYPFTRTPDRDIHKSYVEFFLGHLQPNGILLIELNERDHEKSILATIAGLDFVYDLRRLPFDRIYRTLPLFGLATFTSAIVAALTGRSENKCVLIRQRTKA